MEPRVYWLGHASFRIHSSYGIIYIDPWKTAGTPKADLIIVTHTHMDHLSEDDISKLKKENTIIIGSKDVTEQIPEAVTILPGENKNVGDVKIEAVRAYNPSKEYHPKANDWLGIILTVDGKRIYHTGDTDVIPEMNDVKDIDVLLIPVGGTYTMTAEESVEAVKIISPKKAIPMHWGDIVGGKADAEKFKELAPCDVEILEPKK